MCNFRLACFLLFALLHLRVVAKMNISCPAIRLVANRTFKSSNPTLENLAFSVKIELNIVLHSTVKYI